MIPNLPTAGTDLLESDRRGGFMRVMSRSWYDWALAITNQIAGATGGGSGGVPPGSIGFTQSDVVLGRSSAGAGIGEELPFTDQAQALCDDTSFAAMRATLEIEAPNIPYGPLVPGDWTVVPNDVAEALDLLVTLAVPFDVNTILTDGESVLVDHNGNVLTE